MGRRPLYTTIVILTLALGIGANTAIFSLVNAVLMHPVPTPALDQLVVIDEDLLPLNLLGAELSPGEVIDLAKRKDLFVATAAHAHGSANLTGQGETQRVSTLRTMGNYFGLFGVRPYLGHFYRAEDSADPVSSVVASYGFWQQVLGADPRAVGRSLELNGYKYEITGVLPADFQYPRGVQLYLPFQLEPRWLTPDARKSLFMTMLARRRDDVTPQRLSEGLQLEVGRWRQQYQEGYDPKSFVLHARPFTAYVAGDLRPVLLALMGAVVLVLLIACANVGSLQLVLAARRAKEIAVRAALGAGRATIVRWLLVESIVLAIAGGLVGTGIGVVILRLVTRLNATQYRLLAGVHLDGAVLLFTSGVVVVAALLFGVLPAWRASRVDLQDALKDSSRGSSMTLGRHRLLQASVVVQVALTLMLLLASALTVRSLLRVLDIDPGFRPAQVTTMTVTLSGARYSSNAARMGFHGALLDRLRAIAGIESAGLVSYLPFNGGTDSSPFDLPGRPPQPNEPARHANTQVIEGDYFRAMGIPILRGRTFSASDAGGAETFVIDEYLAKSFFGNEDPVGKAIQHNNRGTIIGVAGTVAQGYLGQAPHPMIYHFFPHNPWLGTATIVVRSGLPDERVASLVRSTVRDIDAQLPVVDIKSMPERINASLTPRRLVMYVLLGFAALSLALSLLGIYGVISYSTAQRTQEIGIRMALGAKPVDITRMILRGALTLAGIGAVGGAVLFLGVGRVVASLLYGIGPRDPLTLAACVLLLGGVALVASYVPARRAARVDPLVALRSE
ncbi:MAG: hypothetical protein DMD26_10050 [Gemmatimonadetes bacterium]|nr:MAG: hypothetical protein DMD26_10050 [Gemmatimonadota bacterium]